MCQLAPAGFAPSSVIVPAEFSAVPTRTNELSGSTAITTTRARSEIVAPVAADQVADNTLPAPACVATKDETIGKPPRDTNKLG